MTTLYGIEVEAAAGESSQLLENLSRRETHSSIPRIDRSVYSCSRGGFLHCFFLAEERCELCGRVRSVFLLIFRVAKKLNKIENESESEDKEDFTVLFSALHSCSTSLVREFKCR